MRTESVYPVVNKPKRIVELDYIKGLAILSVVIGHTLVDFNTVVLFYWVHMPIFFIASGYTLKSGDYFYNNLYPFIIKKIKACYLPFLYYSLPIILLHNLLYHYGAYDQTYSINDYFMQLIRTLFMSMGNTELHLRSFWFLKVLFLAEIYYALFEYAKCKFSIGNIWLWGICLFCFLPSPLFPHILLMNFFTPFRAILYFKIGQCLKKVRFNKLSTFIAFIGFVGWIIISFAFEYEEKPSINGSNTLFCLIQVPLSICVFVTLYKLAAYLRHLRCSSIILWIGRNTLPLYLLHTFVFVIISLLIIFIQGRDYRDITLINHQFLQDIPWWIYSILCVILSYIIWRCVIGLKRLILFIIKR